MKTLRTPLGSVAALIVLATTAHGSVVISNFSDVPIPEETPVSVDIDSDSTPDFSVVVNGSILEIDAFGNNLLAAPVGQLNIYALGDTIQATDPNFPTSAFTTYTPSSDFYVGVAFESNSQFYTAWMQFSFDSLSNGELVNAAWQNAPGQDLVISTVPEPSACGLVAGLAAGLLAWVRRRNRHGRLA